MTMESFPIHEAAAAGDIATLNQLLSQAGDSAAANIERFDPEGYTALMCAIRSPARQQIGRATSHRSWRIHTQGCEGELWLAQGRLDAGIGGG